jgi:4-amino-4-deoxy-L-arabinose transferase-like glycosyltransferase
MSRRALAPAALVVLVGVSLYLRTGQLGAGLWIDEGISIGIAHHHWTSIPGLLNRDGSPPAYYLLLSLWIQLFGDSERATHTLSLLFGLACIPVAFFAGRALFGRATGLVCALLAALDPYLTYYAQETRMYELEAFLSLVVVYAWVQGILRGRNAWTIALVPAIDLAVYTHNWALFLCVGLFVATFVVARDRLKRFALMAVGVAVLYLPWAPTLLSQARHTGAPWSSVPGLRDLILAPGAPFSGDASFAVFVIVCGFALAAVVHRRGDEERSIVVGLAIVAGVTIVLAWATSQISPAWTTRYFAVVLGPLLLLAGHGLVRARRLGMLALVVMCFIWFGYTVRDDKENAREVTAPLSTHPGELVVSTHPEQVPVLRYYLGGGLRWTSTIGPVSDPQIFDWRDAVDRLRAAGTRERVDATIVSVQRGSEFLVVAPVFRDYRAWKAKWTRLVWQKSTAYTDLLGSDRRVRLVRRIATDEVAVKHNYFKPLQVLVYRRLR